MFRGVCQCILALQFCTNSKLQMFTKHPEFAVWMAEGAVWPASQFRRWFRTDTVSSSWWTSTVKVQRAASSRPYSTALWKTRIAPESNLSPTFLHPQHTKCNSLCYTKLFPVYRRVGEMLRHSDRNYWCTGRDLEAVDPFTAAVAWRGVLESDNYGVRGREGMGIGTPRGSRRRNCDYTFSPCTPFYRVGRDRSVGIATRYGLGGSGIESRWGGAIFSAPVQAGPGAHPASYTRGIGSLCRRYSGRDVALTTHPI